MSSEKNLRGHAESALRNMTQGEDGIWSPRPDAGPWMRDLVRAVCANTGTAFNGAVAMALVTALKDMTAGRRVHTSTGHIAKGFILGTMAARGEGGGERTAMGQRA